MVPLSTYKVEKKNKKAFWLQHRYFHDYETKAAQVVPVLQSDAQFPKAVF